MSFEIGHRVGVYEFVGIQDTSRSGRTYRVRAETSIKDAPPPLGSGKSLKAEGCNTSDCADTRSFTATYLRDPDSSAVRDMARLRATRPPAGVARLDLRLATDAIVSTPDARDPGVASRILLPGSIAELEGHGGILNSVEALDLTMATIRTKAVPADHRGAALRAASGAMASSFDFYAGLALAGVCGLCLLGGFGALVRRSLRRPTVWPPISE